jgi:hypothetical protein
MIKKKLKCNECEEAKKYHVIIDYLYCQRAGMQICVGHEAKRVPMWCPKKNETEG